MKVCFIGHRHIDDTPELLEMQCVEDLEKIEPCGTGNPRPRLCILGAELTECIPIGNGRHLRLLMTKFGQSFEAVFFNRTLDQLGLRPGDCVDAAFYPQINEFRGRRSVQLLLNELRLHDCSAAVSILSGADPEAFGGFLPERCEFEQIWRSLRARGGRMTAPVQRFADLLCPTVREETLFLCLKVFEELGLVTLTQDGDALTAVCGEGRADLENSELLERLREHRLREAEDC